MEEKKEVKISLATVICIIIIIILLCVIGEMWYYYNHNDNNKNNENIALGGVLLNNTKNEDEGKSVEFQKIETPAISGVVSQPSGDIVYTYYKTEKEGPNYRIPKIDIESDDVKEINNEIEEMVQKSKQNIEEYNKNGVEEGPTYIDYRYFICNDILSVVIEYSSGYDFIEYKVYKINTKTGKKLTNEDILKIKNISINEFEERLSKTLGDDLEEFYKNPENEQFKEEYKEIYSQTISKENCNINNNQVFLNDENEVCVVAKEYSIAGAGRYYYIFKLK